MVKLKKRNLSQNRITTEKMMLCVWWNMKCVVSQEVQNPNETINTEKYYLHLEILHKYLQENSSTFVHHKIMLL